ncbi:MAG: glutathione S-transferase family protein [Alphaproteobacteria bacterium]|nr:glutathione S-transferase family protein [Alphaproteobacteria bacterium]
MSNLQILGAPQSPLVWAVRMTAAEKGIDVDLLPMRPHTPEIQAIQPFGKIPAMRHGDIELSESCAIARYIDGLDSRVKLMPAALVDAARVEQWIMHFHTEYLPLMLGRYIVQYFFPANGVPDRKAIEATLAPMEKATAILERQLDGRDYLLGDFSQADIFFAPLLHYLSALPEGGRIVAAAPRVAAYVARLSARAAFKATFPPPLPGREAAA